jgi:hypothetical protein
LTDSRVRDNRRVLHIDGFHDETGAVVVSTVEEPLEDFHTSLLRLVRFRLPLLLSDFEALDAFVRFDSLALAFETLSCLNTE